MPVGIGVVAAPDVTVRGVGDGYGAGMDPRSWPAANRLHAHAVPGSVPIAPLVTDAWVPDLHGRSARLVVWGLMADLVAAVEPHLDQLKAPRGVTGRDRLSWALGGTPGHVDRLADGEDGLSLQVHDLSVLLYLAGVDRAGLERSVSVSPLSMLAEGAGLGSAFVAAAAQAEAWTASPSPVWLKQVADAADVTVGQVEAAWVAGALSWACGATPGCGLPRSRQALPRAGAATLWRRQVSPGGVSVPADWVVLRGGGTLADLSLIMDDVGQGTPADPGAQWQWRVPATGIVMTADTVRRGMLLLGCLDMEASPEPTVGGGAWVAANSTVTVAADVVADGASVMLVDRRSGSATAVFTLVGALTGEVADADRFLRAQQGHTVGAVWPSSGLAVERVARDEAVRARTVR
jgi:hypothetical protein